MKADSRQPRVAVVGTGYWGKNLVRNFSELGALAAVCDRDQAILAQFEGLYPTVSGYRDFSELLLSDDIDAVVLATPAETHFPMARQALESGKDVFVEKPLALASAEGDELERLAAARGRVLMVGHLLHYHPAMKAVRAVIGSGELGDLYYMSSNRLNLGRVRREENVLWSFAPHDVSVMLMIAGMPESVAASGGAYLQEDVFDTTITNLVFPGGIRGHIYVSWLHPFKDHKLVLIGSRRMLVFDDLESEEKIRLYDKGVAGDDVTAIRSNGYEPVPFDRAEPLKVECSHFLECVARRSRPDTDGVNGADVLRVLEAAQSSLDSGGSPVLTGAAGRAGTGGA
ncbi:MAG: gfo/Idh/MocA family oxidoreductase [Gaiellales bacterium]|nr:MAG: gfo/Idh/MocA family oxidoreductase [Gaiellales bacterium]